MKLAGAVKIVACLVLVGCGGSSNAPAPQPKITPIGDTMGVLSSKQAKQLFGAKTGPTAQAPAAFGSYAKGCMAGAEELPESGPTWQAMRLSRNRNWGHPELIDFIKGLSQKAAAQPGWSGLYVGDLSQPRGGPMLTGHRSHQIGLDADIWMRPANDLRLTRSDREAISSISMWRNRGGLCE